MRDAGQLPVLVGIGQVRGNRERTVAGAREPVRLILDALCAAAADATPDASCRLVRDLDAIDTVHVVSWTYADLASMLAERLGADPRYRGGVPVGGHHPAELVDRAAARIAAGESRVSAIVGGEAQASVAVLARAGVDPARDLSWSAEPGGPACFDPDVLGSPAMRAAGLVLPTRVYPLFENALAHRLGHTPAEAAAWSAALYAGFSQVAAANPAAWDPRVRTAAEIAEVAPGNRMVCEPYPLAMNAMPLVDQAAAVVLTSLAAAREYGVPEEKIVHVWGGAGAVDAADVLQRPSFGDSAALASVLDRCLAAGGLTVDELDVIDVYSCFPVVPKIAIRHLGLPSAAVPTVTGGHSAFGGPLSNYSLHALVAAAGRLRSGARTALVQANGGYLTQQHAVLLGRDPHPRGYIGDPEPVATAGPAPRVISPVEGEAVVETATVEHGREGGPDRAFLVARTAAGERFAVQTAPGDAASVQVLSLYGEKASREVVGRRVRVELRDGFAVVDPA
ncbi:acetyl-CoA acetyltransferase [Pseudonocardia asaccharolytica]|uniref:Acetyl-CoA acetyltransferase n=1 Tax=Pseudonocardia asaccharolytica DSM 44247 = NBRC 16224 TaxID=1123024 RepID=A0A511CZA4_9PSEU|nr:acetyl-CoA acetyltransferase [Pseudonocardia asaccharolytica]GEL17866.1 acetyl-CoA acetyltransferase [Pseudonocardia asaccharolytica DSM 44247 = NBRC 16224]